jgi:hypothetical protein
VPPVCRETGCDRAIVAGAEFALAAFFAPQHDYLSKLWHQAASVLRITREDALGVPHGEEIPREEKVADS